MGALALLLVMSGRVTGVRELSQIGFGLLALLFGAAVVVRRTRVDLSARRRISPQRGATAGTKVTVSVEVSNQLRRRVPTSEYEDSLDRALGTPAPVPAPSLRSREQAHLAYELTPPRRGIYTVGPGHLIFQDPFRVARTRRRVAEPQTISVYPRRHLLSSLPPSAGVGAGGVSRTSFAPSTSGSEFFAIREYRSGDDLRKVHWPSSARRSMLMIRQEERYAEPAVTLIVDDRTHSYRDPETFEACLESAASLLDLFFRNNFAVRMALGSDGQAEFEKGTDHYHRLMQRLAGAQPHGIRPPAAALADLQRHSASEEVTILVTPRLEAEILSIWKRGVEAGGRLVIVFHDSLSTGEAGSAPSPLIRVLEGGGALVAHVRRGETLSRPWSQVFPGNTSRT